MNKSVMYSCNTEGVGQLTIDLPDKKVNVLSPGVFDDLEKTLEEVEKDSQVKVLLLRSGKPRQFVAGADIEEFTKIKTTSEGEVLILRGQELFSRIEDLKIPTIAVIEGASLGGGMELALSCDYRLVTDEKTTVLGLPEVKLGLLPGWGGTQRLPKIIGLVNSTKLILSGKAVDARKAWKMGLVDAISSQEFLDEELARLIAKVQTGKGQKEIKNRRRKLGGWGRSLVDSNPLGRYCLFRKTHQMVSAESKGHYPAPFEVLKVLKESLGMKRSEGMAVERRGIVNLVSSPISKSLIRLFFLSQTIKKDPGAKVQGNAREITSGAVVGAGVMGGGIAWLFTKNDTSVRIKDLTWEAVGTGLAAASKIYKQLIKIRKYKPTEVSMKMHKITGGTDYTGFKNVDLVIEAVVEDLEVKKTVLQEIEGAVSDEAIIGSNTSSLSLAAMAQVLKKPERFIGIHFFNPVNRMPLVEVIATPHTSADTIATTVSWVKKTGKTPIVVKDCPGFLVNRILIPYINEAGWLLEEGVDYQLIDQVMTSFGMPMGPFELLDQIGLDVGAKVAKSLEGSYGERAKTPAIFEEAARHGLYGKKAGGGFYKKTKKLQRNPKMDSILRGRLKEAAKMKDERICRRLLFSMINEASRCLEESIVASADHLDMAMILGIGFPPFRGGLLYYADHIGVKEVVAELKRFHAEYGDRFAPSALLLKMEQENQSFTQGK
jgi:3-hydroxyacyl-CoA dehydrogenase/enoyl-CoA hydratase/3-hydroxybutyryl-CoA epimerase